VFTAHSKSILLLLFSIRVTLLCIQEMAERQRHKTGQSESTSNNDDDHPRSILKPAPSISVAIASPRPTFAKGM